MADYAISAARLWYNDCAGDETMKKEQPKVMVCVTRQKTCERLIKFGASLAEEERLDLLVVHAVKTGDNFLGNKPDGEALEYLFDRAREVGAELTMIRAGDVEKARGDYARAHNVKLIVMGQAPQQAESIITRLQKQLPDIKFRIVMATSEN
jgi:K+-sensing histidine kinase KdpD